MDPLNWGFISTSISLMTKSTINLWPYTTSLYGPRMGDLVLKEIADLGESHPIHIGTDTSTADTTHRPEQKETHHLIQKLRKESQSGALDELAHKFQVLPGRSKLETHHLIRKLREESQSMTSLT